MKFSTTDLFVSYSGYGIEDNDIFTSMEEAEEQAKSSNERYHTLVFSDNNTNPYKAMSLYDAIEEENDRIRETTENIVRENIGSENID